MDKYWLYDWFRLQGFLHNDDDLLWSDEGAGQPDTCNECGGSGESLTRDWDDNRKQRVRKCKACAGNGFVVLRV